MPNAAVISADKMNVVYRGVANPMTISIPGIPDNKVRASAPGLSRRSGSQYIMNPGTGRSVTITASGTLPDGKPISSKMSSVLRIFQDQAVLFVESLVASKCLRTTLKLQQLVQCWKTLTLI